MKRVWVSEHGRLYKGQPGEPSGFTEDRVTLSPEHFDRLQRFDEQLSLTEGRQVFEWHSRYACATQWVGVMQVPGLSVEVLPKIEKPGGNGDRDTFARKNLLTMLSLTGELPIRERDLAVQAVYSAPLIEALIRIFAERLFEELNRGVERGYVRLEDNLSVLRGKLMFSDHIRHNAARRERLFVAFEEFLADTPMNRIFKAACRRLLQVSCVPATQERLQHCLMVLDEVADVTVQASDFAKVVLNRQNERFREVFNFCELILLGNAPAGTHGEKSTFSLFFDMNVVFESYITELIRRFVLRDELADCHCYPQSKRQIRHLVFAARPDRADDYDPERHGGKTYPLKADILLERGSQRMVLDTKWKRLSPETARQGLGRDDLLQLYAYATRYEAAQNVLLYPKVDGVSEVEYHLPLRGLGLQSIRVCFVDLRRDLKTDRSALVEELRDVIGRSFR